MKRLVLSPRAEADLEDIGDYIARDNPLRALSFVSALQEHCQRIVQTPYAFVLREDVGPGIRMALYGRYRIFFRIEAETVRIERIIHGARRLPGPVRPTS